MKNNGNIKYVYNLTPAQQKEVAKELARALKSVKGKPIPKVCKPNKKN